MPVESRPSDTFTKDNLLIGFSVVEFTPAVSGGGFGTPVQVGILAGEELQKEIELLQLQRGDSGTLTVDRELISSIEVTMQLEVFNFRADIAELIFGSTDRVAISADAASSVVNEQFTVPNSGAEAERTFIGLDNADIDEATFIGSSVTCDTITDEAVGTGDGVIGDTPGDFSLDFKVVDFNDLTTVTVGGASVTPVTGTTPSAGEVTVTGGTGALSSELDFGTIPASGAAIVITYTPAFTFANLTDYVVDPTLGRIRMLAVNTEATDELRGAQPMLADYSYDRKASNDLKPFTRTQVDGKCTIKHLTDIGVNFIWTIPSATILITDDALTFGAEEFGTATLALNVNDAGGTDRFGTLQLSSETEANA
jgi:hypothetical protein